MIYKLFEDFPLNCFIGIRTLTKQNRIIAMRIDRQYNYSYVCMENCIILCDLIQKYTAVIATGTFLFNMDHKYSDAIMDSEPNWAFSLIINAQPCLDFRPHSWQDKSNYLRLTDIHDSHDIFMDAHSSSYQIK